MIEPTHPWGWILRGINGNLIVGPAAVIVFFVISGFCIHFPFREGGRPLLLGFLARRYLRIVLPVIVAVAAAKPLGIELTLFRDSILWSLLAELIYYTIYPLLLGIRQRYGWRILLTASALASLTVVLSDPVAGNYPSFGSSLNWVLGLPCWLIGCYLAEACVVPRVPRAIPGNIWIWRAGIWLLSSVFSVLRYHTPVGFPWSLNLFAVAVFFWLTMEIRHFSQTDPPRFLEWGGRWSYSIYLMHLPAAALMRFIDLPDLGGFLNWALMLLGVLLLCFAFFILVEHPAHRLARVVPAWIARAQSRGRRGALPHVTDSRR